MKAREYVGLVLLVATAALGVSCTYNTNIAPPGAPVANYTRYKGPEAEKAKDPMQRLADTIDKTVNEALEDAGKGAGTTRSMPRFK